MIRKMITKDIQRSKWVTASTTLFVAAAVMLVSLAAVLAVNLVGAISTLTEQAKTPHFMQMHSGNLSLEAISSFAEAQDVIDQWQVLEYLNLDGADFVIGEKSLESSVQDNGLTLQGAEFDYLLDLGGNVIVPNAGEIYVPLAYYKDGFASVGDTLAICGHPLRVVGFLRDSQMNSSLSSSKRFLVHRQDYDLLHPYGSVEYLIEFRLKDTQRVSDLEAAYLAASLPANGPLITYPLFSVINGLSDGILIGIILLISLLVIAVTFLCIRFTLLVKIEDEIREIGVLKALGLRVKDIKQFYLAKYAAIGALGGLLGFGLSFAFRNALLENIRLYMGESGYEMLSLVLGFIGGIVVIGVILIYVNQVLHRFKKISGADALRLGASQDKPGKVKRFSLAGRRFPSVNTALGIKDVLLRTKLYGTLLFVLVVASFILITPQNLYNTISSGNFARYMGIGASDLRIDIQQTDDIPARAMEMEAMLLSDPAVARYSAKITQSFTVLDDNGVPNRLKIELGDHATFPVEYTRGQAPGNADEIALSVMQADDLGKTVSDTMRIITSSGKKMLTVCGIYSDVTNGGKTAKAAFADDDALTMWCVINIDFVDSAMCAQKQAEYAAAFTYAKVSDIAEYTEQTLGSTISAVRIAARTSVLIAIALVVVIVLLFTRMLIAKDRHDIAAMKAFGFTNRDIRRQYIARIFTILIPGIIAGAALAGTLGSMLTGAFMSFMGIASFRFTINPFVSYLLCPAAIGLSALVATYIAVANAGTIKIIESIKE